MPGVIKRFKAFQGPTTLEFIDPDTGFHYKAATKEALFDLIINYRIQNRLDPIKALDTVLENYWCSKPENAGKCEVVQLSRGWYHYLSGGISLLENLFFGEKNMVTQEDADWRAAICSECKHNVFTDKGDFIKWSDEIAEASTGGKKSKFYDELGNCEICTCPLRAKVWAKEASMTKEESDKAPSWCWAKTK